MTSELVFRSQILRICMLSLLIRGIILTTPEKKIISILNKSENATCDCNVSAKGKKTGNKDAHSS